MTVGELDLRMSSYELTEWMAYEKITGPLGRKRGDIQAATIAATEVNIARGKKGKKAKISDFLIDYGRESTTQTPEEMLRVVKGITASMGGTVKGAENGDD